MSECTVCLEYTNIPPFGVDQNGPPAPVSSLCGHIFHHYCWRMSVNAYHRCPTCQRHATLPDHIRIFVEDDPIINELRHEVENLKVNLLAGAASNNALETKNNIMRQEVDGLKINLIAISESNNALMTENEKLQDEVRSLTSRRRGFNRPFKIIQNVNATCLNCESIYHQSRNCEFPPFVRNREYSDRSNTEYNFQYEMIGASEAGSIIKNYEDKLGMVFNREEIQVIFGFVFFDNACWNCASTKHEKRECLNTPAPGIKKIARLMQDEVHPPSEAEVANRREKYLRFRKK